MSDVALDKRDCPVCQRSRPADSFRKGAKLCRWCQWKVPRNRARARYRDLLKGAGKSRKPVTITLEEFIEWYEGQSDSCYYCGVTFDELAELHICRAGGYYAGWDIDRKDSSRGYESGNLVLSCFLCNMAKGDVLNVEEARIIGNAVQQIWKQRLADKHKTDVDAVQIV